MEIWKSFADGYEVSTAGNIKSFKRKTPKILTPTLNKQGYLCVSLIIGNEQKKCSVHRLVAQAFIPNPENKREVNHLNGDKTDNRVENLEWCTRDENICHAIETRLYPHGENFTSSKLTNEQVVYIRDNPNGLSTCKLAAQFGVSNSTISEIQRGKRYKTAGGTIRRKIDIRIPDEVRDEIRHLYKLGVLGCGSYVIGRNFGISPITVRRILKENHQEQLQSHVRD